MSHMSVCDSQVHHCLQDHKDSPDSKNTGDGGESISEPLKSFVRKTSSTAINAHCNVDVITDMYQLLAVVDVLTHSNLLPLNDLDIYLGM